MNAIQIILLAGCLTVFICDTVSLIASRKFNFNSAHLAPLSFIVYAATGFAGAIYANQTAGVILAASVGFFDATIGWKTSIALNANTDEIENNPSASRWIAAAILVTVLSAICGFAGSEILWLIKR